ncbi:unnamed protein product [Orchesella dallaii]|uniref:Gustatory receptor n=1 Tax=Orchesella dallaii TaxID=48710 RepID=A0ABP1RWT0_9HEXA
MMLWFTFGVPAGQALVIAGFLDVLIGMAKCLHAFMRSMFGDGHNRRELTEFSWHLDYLELTQAGIEGSKIILAIVLWIGVILIGRLLVLKVWIYLTIAVDLLQLLLIGVINYHFWLTDVKSEKYVSPFHFIYITIIRLLMRAYLIVVAMNYTKTYAKFRSKVEIATSTNVTPAIQRRQEQCQNELAKELMPIGMGFCKLFQFYLIDADRLARFLLISDFVWCVCKVLSREVSQAVFGREELFYPSSSYLTPILVEERFIRISRILFDVYFLQAIHKVSEGV